MFRKENKEKNLFIISYLNSILPLSSDFKSFLAEKVKSSFFNKNELISKQGEICNKLYIIKTGMVRAYFQIGNKDITTWIVCENEVFTSITGFFSNSPSEESMQCIEETHYDYLDYVDYRYCVNHFPEMRRINAKVLEHYYAMAERRALLARLPNAQDRLSYFIETNQPNLINRIPKKHLASHLAIRPETLSRLLREVR